jgi:EF hand
MKMLTLSIIGVLSFGHVAFAQDPAQNIARGTQPLNVDVNEMDANHDGVITKDEFAAYGEKIWKVISRGKATVPVDTAATDFATGNMSMKVHEMDTNHDGVITHEEFINYGSKYFDKAQKPAGPLTLADATKYFATGNKKP